MKKVLIGVGLVALLVVAWTVGRAQAQPKVAEFKITVQLTGGGLIAQCSRGCAWQELSYGCGDPKKTCKAEIDQLGVGGVVGAR